MIVSSTRELLASQAKAADSAEKAQTPEQKAAFQKELNGELNDITSVKDKVELTPEAAALALLAAAQTAQKTELPVKVEGQSVPEGQQIVSDKSKLKAAPEAANIPTDILAKMTPDERVAALTNPSNIAQMPWAKDWITDADKEAAKNLKEIIAPGKQGPKLKTELKPEDLLNPAVTGKIQTPLSKQAEVAGAEGFKVNPQLAAELQASSELLKPEIKNDLKAEIDSLKKFAALQDEGNGNTKVESNPKAAATPVNQLSGADFLLAKQALQNQAAAAQTQTAKTAAGNSGKDLTGEISINPKAKDPRRNEPVAHIQTNLINNPDAAGILAQREAPKPILMTQNVNIVKGSMAKDRLSSEALMGLTGNIRTAVKNEGGGEIKLRLFPENLGELKVKVTSMGSHVKLNIQAASEKAKGIIEDSLSYLKEALTSNQLTLTKVDVSLAPQTQSHNGQGQSNQNQSNQAWDQQAMNLNSNLDQGNRGQAYQEAQRDAQSGVVNPHRSLKDAPIGGIPSGLSSISGARAAGFNSASRGRIDIRV